MDAYLDYFINYLKVERGLSENTLTAYSRDLSRYLRFLVDGQKLAQPGAIDQQAVLKYLATLK